MIVVEERRLAPSRKRLRPAAGIVAAAIVAGTAAGCSSGGAAAQRPNNWASPKATAAPLTASQVLAASAKNSAALKSFASQLSIQLNDSKTKVTMNGSIAEQKNPLSADVNLRSSGSSSKDSGTESVIITPKEAYVKIPAGVMPGRVNTPWLGLNLSSVKENGTSLATLLDQAENNPLSDAEMLTASTNARITGTGSVNGVSATKISGSVPISKALARLPSKERTAFSQEAEQQGIGQIKFTAWIDAKHQLQKMVEDEPGSTFSQTTTMTMLSINQPVTVSAPPKSQVTEIPASVLKDLT